MKHLVVPPRYENGRRLTNAELATTEPVFIKACEVAGLFPSRNRFRKFRYGHGDAYAAAIKHGLLTNGKHS
jgi:hypothetical protein